jgi:hypothetical protein
MRRILVVAAIMFAVGAVPAAAIGPVPDRTLDGNGNNARNPHWGQATFNYIRVAPANYADGVSKMVAGPATRYVSNRIFNDSGQNLFSENDVSQWAWAWGQFLDHDIGLRDENPAEDGAIRWTKNDPLESFLRNDFGAIGFARTPAAAGTGTGSIPRAHVNTISSFIDASNVYGVNDARLDWLRRGTVDGDPENNMARLLLPGNFLPRADARGNPNTAPFTDLFGNQVLHPNKAAIAGDVRANENIALTGIHTLFAREHNRIVAQLPSFLSQEDAFQIARRVVGAEVEFITYNAFLPDLGVDLAPYRGYDSTVNPGISEEFAVVGYRAHSMIHGEFEPTFPEGTFTNGQLNSFERQGLTVEHADGHLIIVIPLVIAFGNPQLLEDIGLGPVLNSLGAEAQYKNDEQIDNSLRSVLFQVPKPGSPDPELCGSPVINPDCFGGVSDLGAIDVERGRDHGMPSYNDLRRAYGLAPKTTFTSITGESTSSFPSDPMINPHDPINDPNILDFVALKDREGNPLPLGTQSDAVVGIRRTTLAARLRAIYGSVNSLDAFTGMVAEKHVAGTEFGPLQLAIWNKQFAALRDGDRFFYANDPALPAIRALFGIDYRRTLAQVIKDNTGVTTQADVFLAAG